MDASGLTLKATGLTQAPPSTLEDRAARKADDPARIHDAAQQFEALLLGQILKSAHSDGGGWLGSGEDQSGGCVSEFADEQFASMLAKQGGLGLATMISAGLRAGGSGSGAAVDAPTPRADVPTDPHGGGD